MPRDGSGVYSKAAGTTAVAGTTIESAKYNSQVDDMVADLNAARPITAGGTGATTAAGAQTNLGLLPGTFGFLYGLTLSNNVSDATNDIDIAAGTAASDAASPILMTLASALTKRLDAAWAVGTNQGGLDTGSIANTTYHIWLIQRSDTSVVDALFSTSATAPTMPANYDRKRRIGSIVRTAAAIKAFLQDGDKFTWMSPSADIAAANPGTSAVTRLLTIPTGFRFRATVSAAFSASTQADIPGAIYLSDLATNDLVPSSSNGVSHNSFGTAVGSYGGGSQVDVTTNVSAQIRSRCQLSTAGTTLFITTYGWFDNRGRI